MEVASRERFLGVDFSGAARAGKSIWIAELRRADAGLVCVDLRPAADLPAGGAEREAALGALRKHLASARGAVVGMDFPFGVPRSLANAADWESFIDGFASAHRDADAFRAALTDAAGGRELKRRTDIETKTPMSPYNLRLYRQTYHGIRDVLAPLVGAGDACCAPMQEIADDRAALVETCPASYLKRRDLAIAYKGRMEEHAAARGRITRALEDQSGLRFRGRTMRRIVQQNPGGDALDALVAAVAVARVAACDPGQFTARAGSDYALEARVII